MIAIIHMWLLRFELIKNQSSLVTLATFQAPNSHPRVSSGYHILHGTEAFFYHYRKFYWTVLLKQ